MRELAGQPLCNLTMSGDGVLGIRPDDGVQAVHDPALFVEPVLNTVSGADPSEKHEAAADAPISGTSGIATALRSADSAFMFRVIGISHAEQRA